MKKLPPVTRGYFERFARDAEAWNWHWMDVDRFRAFIHAAHRWRMKLSRPELERLLLAKKFDRKDAADLADLYEFGRDLLQHRPLFNDIGLRRIKP